MFQLLYSPYLRYAPRGAASSLSYLLLLVLMCCYSMDAFGQPDTYYLTEWYASDGLPGNASERVVSVVDGSDNLYVAGVTLNAYDKYDLLLTKFDDNGDPLWSETFNLSSTSATVVVGQIILDYSGNPVVTGSVYNGSTNKYDALVVKFNTSGVYQWHELFNGTGNHNDAGVALFSDNSDNLYIAGGTTDDTDLMDFLIVAYEGNGDLLWSRTIDGHGYMDAATTIYPRSSTQLTVIGVMQEDLNTWELGQQMLYMSDGTPVSSMTTYGDTDVDELRDVTTDATGNIYMTGYVDNGATDRDILLFKFNSTLDLVWDRTWNGTSSLDDEPYAVSVDESDGSVYVAGFSTKTGEGKNFLVLKYNASGTLQWNNTRNGQVDGDDEAFDVVVGESSQIVVAGYIAEEGNKDYFIEILNTGGSSQWTDRFNGIFNGDDRGQKLVVESSGQISLTGKTATPSGDTYTTVRYSPKDILIPPDSEDPSSGLYFTANRGQLLDTEGEEVPEIKYYSDRESPAMTFQDEGFSLITTYSDGDEDLEDDFLYRVDVRFQETKGAQRIYALEPREDFHNYYLGHIPEGREKVGLYDRLIHTDVYEGIDVHYYSNNAGRKYYFVVKPGADPADIRMLFSGQTSLSVNENRGLVIGTEAGDIVFPEPEAFLVNSSGVESSVAWTPEYVVEEDRVIFNLGSYDDTKWLVIRIKEEELTLGGASDWITYFGGFLTTDFTSLHVDEEDNLYVTGQAIMFINPDLAGDIIPFGDVGPGAGFSAMLVKFDPDTRCDYQVLWGGNGSDFDVAPWVEVAFDVTKLDNSLFVVGTTESPDFPTTNGNTLSAVDRDGFIAGFNDASGQMNAMALIGGQGNHVFTSIDTHDGELYLAGFFSPDGNGNKTFPLEAVTGAYNQSITDLDDTDGIIARLNTHFEILWASVFGGDEPDRINEIVIDQNNGHLHATGRTRGLGYSIDDDCEPPTDGGFPNCNNGGTAQQLPFRGGDIESDIFIAEFNDDDHLIWTTFMGGEEEDRVSDHTQSSIVINPVEGLNEIAIIGTTDNFHQTTGGFPSASGGDYLQLTEGPRQFIATFQNRQLTWLSAMGCLEEPGLGDIMGEGVTYSHSGELFAVGFSECDPQDDEDWCTAPDDNTFPICPPLSTDFFFQDHLIPSGFQAANHGEEDAYVSGFSTTKEIFYSTFLGGNQFEYPVATAFSNVARSLFIVGNTRSTGVSMQLSGAGGFLQTDGGRRGFIARLDLPVSVNTEEVISKEEEHFKLFPNPSNGHLKIELSKPGLPGMDVRLFDILGQLIGSWAFSPHSLTTSIDVTYLPAGVYTVAVGNSTQLFIKQ